MISFFSKACGKQISSLINYIFILLIFTSIYLLIKIHRISFEHLASINFTIRISINLTHNPLNTVFSFNPNLSELYNYCLDFVSTL